MAFAPLGGSVHPTVVDGRAPSAADEIALAPGVARRAHLAVGRTVMVTGPAGAVRMTVVGRAVYPAIGPDGDFDNEVSMTPGGYERLGLAGTQLQGPGVLAEHTTMVLVRVLPGAEGAAAGRDHTPAAGQRTQMAAR